MGANSCCILRVCLTLPPLLLYMHACIVGHHHHRAQAKAAEALAAGRKGEEGEKALHDSEGDGEDGDGSREGSEEAVTDQEEGEANNK